MSVRRLLTGAFAAALALSILPSAALAEEVIDNFASQIAVQRDGTLNVAEAITVTAEGVRIRHGITRDFPTTYTDAYGNHVRVRFEVSGVTLDGEPVPFTRESLSNGVRLKIGEADRFVPAGQHTYRIEYTTDRQIGFFEKYDELYWNVTGTGWAFPIEHAEATVHLPQGATIRRSDVYTGAQGAQGHAATAQELDDTDIRFETSAPLSANEGLTVAVAFAKGAVAPPTEAQKTTRFLGDNRPVLVALLGLLALTVYFVGTWWAFGRDPARGTVIPLFGPPKGFSPSAVRYVRHMGYDRKAFAAALIDMAVKGFLTVAEDRHRYTLTRTGKSAQEAGLSKGEAAIARALFDESAGSVELEQANHAAISSAISNLQTHLHNEYEYTYFVTNIGWFAAGAAILILTGIGTALVSDDPSTAGFLLLFVSVWSTASSFLVHRAATSWGAFLHGPGSRTGNLLRAIALSALSVPFVGALALLLAVVAGTVSLLAAIALIVGGVMAYIFYHLLKAPTAAGAKALDEIEGFRLFLDTAEKDRLEALNPPNVTPEVFERFLPYAIALDCENRWSKRFEAEAAAAAADPARASAYAYTPLWYSGGSFGRLGTAGFVSAIGSSVATAAAASATAPGSSSGSYGGGFSGGGGGGGGGGGW